MKVNETVIPGALIIEPEIFGDSRGFFAETYNAQRYRAVGIEASFVQDNLSFSQRGVVRGLHFQNPHPQGKLVQVLQGAVFDVAVDVRVGSPAFGRWAGVELSSDNKHQFYVPPGCAHAFCVTSETALFAYKCTDFYHPEDDGGIIWNDPDIGIDWPVETPLLSAKDAALPRLRDLDTEGLIAF